MTAERLDDILGRFPSLSIAVFGDFYLDKYLITEPALAEPSLETGLDALQVVEVRCQPGAAGTVASNLAALGVGQVHTIGGIGNDGEGFDLTSALRSRRIDTRGLIVSQQRRTPCYMKPMADSSELNRLDIQNREPPRMRLQRKVLEHLASLLPDLNGVMVSDQTTIPDCGMVTPWAREQLAALAESHPPVFFLVDSRSNIGQFRNMALKPNLPELTQALKAPTPEPSLIVIHGMLLGHIAAGLERPTMTPGAFRERMSVRRGQTKPVAKRLVAQAIREVSDGVKGKPVFVTLGADGIMVSEDWRAELVPARPVEGPIDIVGAGDAAGAAILASLCAGATPVEAAEVANLAASVTIRKLGTTGTASPKEIREAHTR